MKEDNKQSDIEFDFDVWMKLAKDDPEAFEKRRQEFIQAAIDDAPVEQHRRLNGLQWSIDNKMKTAKTPIARCLKVYQMMMDSVFETGGLLEALSMTNTELKVNTAQNILRLNGISMDKDVGKSQSIEE